jgi:hypothetical protein
LTPAGLLTHFVVVLAGTPPASAQLMLPGAIHAPRSGGALPGSGDATSADAGQKKPKLARLQRPSEATIVGRELSRDGAMGVAKFRISGGKGLEIARLELSGEAISQPGMACRVDVVAAAPIAARLVGGLGGLARYAVEIAACSFAFAVLDGAVLVTRDLEPCTFAAADCRVDPTGLWGPRGDSIDARQREHLERARAQAESAVQANFRALLATAGKDQAAIKRIAGEQAGFSSERSMACSTYAGEDVHGFCALRLTEARAIALQARREAAVAEQAGKAAARGASRKSSTP